MSSHDIAHCQGKIDGHSCPKRENCHRYLMYEEVLKDHEIQYVSMIQPSKLPCQHYWEENESNN